ncbi:MAG: 16S rRNA (cytidine(1402)-2'-O)-methyltransferase [Syntrophobacterales bacterium]|nr:16S rRNA (cytidine(1402)-2'-O)-methyltransferase [Syntrophobacterales bacterium]
MSGTLYVVATPIGNLKDITLRAIEVLGAVDFIVAEDRDRALKLLSHLDIRKQIISINSYSEERKAKEVCERIEDDKSAALITAAGTPCVSDPGRAVVNRCREAGIEVTAVPGPSAAVGALSISGLYTDRFLFYGFLPLKKGKKKKVLREMAQLPYAIILYESPRRVRETLLVAYEEMGDREAAVFKELTKVHEEVWRGTLGNLLVDFGEAELKGEYVLIVGGAATGNGRYSKDENRHP